MRTMGLTTVASAAVLLMNALSGVLIARLLAPSGKGAVTSIVSWAQLIAWICVLGVPSAMTYLLSLRPADGPRIVGTSVLGVAIFGTVGFLVGEVLITLVFANQAAEIRTLAQVFLLSVFLFVLLDFTVSLASGNRDFTLFNVLRIVQPVTYVLLLVIVSVAARMTVGWALAAAVLALALVAGMGIRRIVRTVGMGRPSASIFRESTTYGLKLQGGTLASLANYRLDILVMPIYLTASSIGVYSVAVSVSSMVLSLVSSLSTVVFPIVTAAGEGAPRLVGRALRMTVLFASVLAVVLFVVAPPLVRVVYGSEFTGATTALRILVGGYVFTAGSSIVVAGLMACNKPLAASASQLAALPVTIIGLLLFLEPFGIEGAAVISTVAYVVAFLIGLTLLSRQAGYSLGALLSGRAMVEDINAVRIRATSLARRQLARTGG